MRAGALGRPRRAVAIMEASALPLDVRVLASVSSRPQSLLPLWIAFVVVALILPVYVAGSIAEHYGRPFWRWGLLGGGLVFSGISLTILTLTAWTP